MLVINRACVGSLQGRALDPNCADLGCGPARTARGGPCAGPRIIRPEARAWHGRPERRGLAAEPPRSRPRPPEKAATGPSVAGPKPGRRPLRPSRPLRGACPAVRGRSAARAPSLAAFGRRRPDAAGGAACRQTAQSRLEHACRARIPAYAEYCLVNSGGGMNPNAPKCHTRAASRVCA